MTVTIAAMILLGTLALCLPVCHGEGASLSVVDAAFLSTSAVCVTGLSPVDISQVLSPVGQGVMLVLIQVGGLGLAPGVNMSDSLAFYEATHGTAPTIAGQDKANPGSVILCGALMLEQMGVPAAAERIRNAMSKAIASRAVTVDLAAQVEGARVVGCQEFGEIIGACL